MLQKYSGSKKVQSAAKQGERFASPEKDSMAVNRKRMTQLKKLKLIMLMDGEQTAKEEYSRSLKRIQGAMVTKRRNNDLNRSKSNKSIRVRNQTIRESLRHLSLATTLSSTQNNNFEKIFEFKRKLKKREKRVYIRS